VWTFKEAEAYLADTAPPGKSIYGLGRINHLLDLLSHPEKSFPCVTIVGTNGKGSVIAFMDSLLRAHAVRVACHIKPHLESVTERIRLNGIDSTKEQFAHALWKVREAVDRGWSREDRPTYFELIFAAFLVAAKTAEVDIALLETGLGGRLDAVNSVDAPLVVMTSVDLDHTELLGDSLRLIALEKLAVVRKDATLVCQMNDPEVMGTVREQAMSVGFKLIEMTDAHLLEPTDEDSFRYHSRHLGTIDNLRLSLSGPFQRLNASLALLAFETLVEDVGAIKIRLIKDAIRPGLSSARIPGRWEKISGHESGMEWILDGGHNPAALKKTLRQFRENESGNKAIIFGMKRGKDVEKVIPDIIRSAARLIFINVPDIDCYSPDELAGYASAELDKSPGFSQIQIDKGDSISEAIRMLSAPDGSVETVLITGSLYLVGGARSILKAKKPIRDAVQ
jgi:dihydrofolate synthase/folylpolyglutamate synthase